MREGGVYEGRWCVKCDCVHGGGGRRGGCCLLV